MRIGIFFRKSVCSLMSAAMMLAPVWSFAGETNVTAIGKDAQKWVEGMGSGKLPTMSGSNLNIEMPDGSTATLGRDALVPQSESKSGQMRFTFDEIEAISSKWNKSSDVDEIATAEKKELYRESGGETQESVEAAAYRIGIEAQSRNRPDITNEWWLDNTRDIQSRIVEYEKKLLSECKKTTAFKKTEKTIHMPEYHECTQVVDQSGTCTITHSYEAGVLTHYAGPYNLASCGPGCMDLWIGRVGDNYWGGKCAIYSENTMVQMIRPEGVKSATLIRAKWDDYMQVWIGKPGQEKLFWTGPYGNGVFPPETPGKCELSTSWDRNPNVDVTAAFRNAKKNDVVNFKVRVSVYGGGEGYGLIRIYYDTDKVVDEWGYTPPSCVATADAIADGFASGTPICTQMPATDANGCVVKNGVMICPDDMEQRIKGVSPLCERIEVTSKYDFYKGQMNCWTDANGKRQCPNNVGGNLNACDAYESNPNCTFVKSQCTVHAKGNSGQCYVNDVTYDCGHSVSTTEDKAETKIDCNGGIACVGDQCVDSDTVVSTDFAKVNALMNAMQYMTQDMSCTGLDKDGNATKEENITCTVFAGEPGECKVAVGGWSNCCKNAPGGVGLGDYLRLAMSVNSMDSELVTINKLSTGKGAASMTPDIVKNIAGQYTEIRGDAIKAVEEGVSYITKPFADVAANISNPITDLYQAADKFVEELEKEIIKKMEEMLTQLFEQAGIGAGEAAASGAASGAAQEASKQAAEQTMANIGMAFSVISWIYTAYCIANMVVNMVYACETEEYEVVTKREQKNCHFIGSYCKSKVLGVCIEKRQVYCCYNSPLSRIVNEQVRLQGNILGTGYNGWGSPEHPQCQGVPLDKVDRIDWDRIDLSEWTGILIETNNFPTEKTIDLDSLTGAGSRIDYDGTRLNTYDRNVERLEDTDVDGVRQEGAKTIGVDVGNGPQS